MAIAGLVQAFSKLIIVEKKGSVFAIDQHAADERVRLERAQDALCACLSARSQTACRPSTVQPVAAPDAPVSLGNSETWSSSCSHAPQVLKSNCQSVDGSVLNNSGDLLLSRRLKSAQSVHVSPVQRLRLCQPQIQVYTDIFHNICYSDP